MTASAAIRPALLLPEAEDVLLLMDFLVEMFNKHNKRMSVFLSESFDVLFEEN